MKDNDANMSMKWCQSNTPTPNFC